MSTPVHILDPIRQGFKGKHVTSIPTYTVKKFTRTKALIQLKKNEKLASLGSFGRHIFNIFWGLCPLDPHQVSALDLLGVTAPQEPQLRFLRDERVGYALRAYGVRFVNPLSKLLSATFNAECSMSIPLKSVRECLVL